MKNLIDNYEEIAKYQIAREYIGRYITRRYDFLVNNIMAPMSEKEAKSIIIEGLEALFNLVNYVSIAQKREKHSEEVSDDGRIQTNK